MTVPCKEFDRCIDSTNCSNVECTVLYHEKSLVVVRVVLVVPSIVKEVLYFQRGQEIFILYRKLAAPKHKQTSRGAKHSLYRRRHTVQISQIY